MTGWIMKTYLHKPPKILQFLSREKVQKWKHKFEILQDFQQKATCKLSRAYNKGFYYIFEHKKGEPGFLPVWNFGQFLSLLL